MPKYAAFDADLAEYLSVALLLPQNATVLPLFFTDEHQGEGGTAVSLRTRPLETAAGYLMAERGVVDLAHYEAAFNYFPVQFRESVAPFRFIGSSREWQEQIPPVVEFQSYSDRTPGKVDYVLLWGETVASDHVRTSPAVESVRRQLTAAYRLMFTSPRGLLAAYRSTAEP